MKSGRVSVLLVVAGVLVTLGMVQPALAGGGYTSTCHDATGAVVPCPIKCSECFWYNTYNTNDPPAGTGLTDPAAIIRTVTSSGSLASGVPYTITITGTYSAWGTPPWPVPPLPASFSNAPLAPIFPSPSPAANGPVGLDWEFIFCSGFTGNVPVTHLPQDGLSLDGGVTFHDQDPDGCPGTLPSCENSAHQYHYTVVGQGKPFTVIKYDSGPHSDNYGQFRICIQRLSPCGYSCDKCTANCGGPS